MSANYDGFKYRLKRENLDIAAIQEGHIKTSSLRLNRTAYFGKRNFKNHNFKKNKNLSYKMFLPRMQKDTSNDEISKHCNILNLAP